MRGMFGYWALGFLLEITCPPITKVITRTTARQTIKIISVYYNH